MSQSIIPLAVPTHVKLKYDGLDEWNQYGGLGGYCPPRAESWHVFTVLSSLHNDRIYRINHPAMYDLFMAATQCILVEYNSARCEWVELNE